MGGTEPSGRAHRYAGASDLERAASLLAERLPAPLRPFARLAYNYRWSWSLEGPELFRAMVDQGAELIALPAAFTHATGRAHWEVLLRARAIENLCFVLASAQGGLHFEGRRTFGHSQVIGLILVPLPDDDTQPTPFAQSVSGT